MSQAAEILALQRPRGMLGAVSTAWYLMRRWPIIPGVVMTILAIFAIFAPFVSPKDPNKQDLRIRNTPPIWETQWYEEHPTISRHVLGADYLGRDVLSRVIYGARMSLMIASIATLAGVTLGTLTGLASGYYGGVLDEIAMRFVDIWFAVPFLLIALVVAITIGTSVATIMWLLAFATWVGMVRNIRADVLSLKTRDYVDLARVTGASDWRIMLWHILPGVLSTVVVLATLRVGGLILAESGLSYLGAGIPASIPSWGRMISDGREYLSTAWWTSVFPGVGLFLTVMSMNFIGDWLRDRLDPRLRQI